MTANPLISRHGREGDGRVSCTVSLAPFLLALHVTVPPKSSRVLTVVTMGGGDHCDDDGIGNIDSSDNGDGGDHCDDDGIGNIDNGDNGLEVVIVMMMMVLMMI